MTSRIADISQRKATRVAGIAFLLTLIIPILSTIFVYSKLIVSGNAVATANNIMANEVLFRIGIASDLIMSMNVVVLSLALYVILKTVNQELALFALLWRLGEATLVGVAALSSLIALLLLNGGVYSVVFESEQLQALAGLFLDVRYAVFSITFAFLGLGMTVFCYLFFKSRYIPGILAAFGIVSYLLLLIYSFVNILLPNYAAMIQIQVIFYTASCLFEPAIGLWLLFKGVNVQLRNSPASASS